MKATTHKSWRIAASGPPQGQSPHHWRQNMQVCVFAPTLYAAMAAFRAQYPDCEPWTITHEGERMLVDAEASSGS